jgi:hypothetical protein
MQTTPYEIKVLKGAHQGNSGKVVGRIDTGNGPFYRVHFRDSHGELTSPPPAGPDPRGVLPHRRAVR